LALDTSFKKLLNRHDEVLILETHFIFHGYRHFHGGTGGGVYPFHQTPTAYLN